MTENGPNIACPDSCSWQNGNRSASELSIASRSRLFVLVCFSDGNGNRGGGGQAPVKSPLNWFEIFRSTSRVCLLKEKFGKKNYVLVLV